MAKYCACRCPEFAAAPRQKASDSRRIRAVPKSFRVVPGATRRLGLHIGDEILLFDRDLEGFGHIGSLEKLRTRLDW
jgi:hypothetical protein